MKNKGYLILIVVICLVCFLFSLTVLIIRDSENANYVVKPKIIGPANSSVETCSAGASSTFYRYIGVDCLCPWATSGSNYDPVFSICMSAVVDFGQWSDSAQGSDNWYYIALMSAGDYFAVGHVTQRGQNRQFLLITMRSGAYSEQYHAIPQGVTKYSVSFSRIDVTFAEYTVSWEYFNQTDSTWHTSWQAHISWPNLPHYMICCGGSTYAASNHVNANFVDVRALVFWKDGPMDTICFGKNTDPNTMQKGFKSEVYESQNYNLSGLRTWFSQVTLYGWHTEFGIDGKDSHAGSLQSRKV